MAIEMDDEESRIKALVETPALKWGNSASAVVCGGYVPKAPPPGYVCHRCSQPGHLIQHCPTNGNPQYDVKRFRPPTGIPASMLVPAPNGCYALPSGAVGVMRPNEAAFEKAMEEVPTSLRSAASQLPPELHCQLCKQVMKDAVLTSRCCFDSFCDGCIRGHIISKCSCVCGATDVLADHLIPNMTLRNTISRILGSNSSGNSGEEGALQNQHLPSTQQSALQKQEPVSEKMSAPLADEEKKAGMAMPVAANNCMMPPMGYNPYWGGMNAFMPPYGYGYGYGYGPMNMPFWGGEQNKNSSGMVGSNAESREANEKRKRDEDQEPAREERGSGDNSYRRDHHMEHGREERGSGDKKLENHHSDFSHRSDHHREHGREVMSSSDMYFSKIRNSDRPSLDQRFCDPQFSNKKLEYHPRDHRDDHHRREERHHRDHSHCSSSSYHCSESKPMYATERKRANVYIPPEQPALKKQKLSSSSLNSRKSFVNYEQQHNQTPVRFRKTTAPASISYDQSNYDDDDRHYKRRSTWYKPSHPAPRPMSFVKKNFLAY